MTTRRIPFVLISFIALTIGITTPSTDAATFGDRIDLATGTSPTGFAVADLNRDGVLDLIVANLTVDTISVFLGNGTGGFATATSHTAGEGPLDVAVADLNLDGAPDVATANTYGNSVSVFLGTGDGTFVSKTDYSTGSTPSGIAIADADADGQPDILTTNPPASGFVLRGHGDGTFASPVPFTTGSSPQALAVADFNGDGKIDVATANYGAGTVSILLGTGTGSFAPKTDYAAGASPTALAAGDLDADGIVDLVAANFSAAGSITVLPGSGTGAFGAGVSHTTPSAPSGVALADVDVDGNLDVLSANYADNSVSVFSGDGSGGLGSRVDFATGLVAFAVDAGDFDRDGLPDIASTNINGASVSVRLNTTAVTPSGYFAAESEFPLSANLLMPHGLVLNDFNRDGVVDAATANLTGDSISIAYGTGDGFGSSTQYGTGSGTSPYSLCAGDLNHDGRLDLVVTNSAEGFDTVGVMLATDMGGYGPGITQYGTGSSPKGLALADLNHDGHLDIVTTNYIGNSVSVLLGTGLGTFGAKSDFATEHFPEDVAVGDFDRDGNLDLATANMGVNHYVSILRGNGDGTFGPSTNIQISVAGGSPYAIAVADLNRDGRPDVVTVNPGTSTISVLLGDGAGGFATSVEYPVEGNSRALTVADLNGDAIPDLVTASHNAKNLRVINGLGDGTFGSAAAYYVGDLVYGVETGDVNGDGRPDIVAGEYGNSRLSLFRNSTPQTADFGVVVTADPQSVTIGTPVTYAAVITNHGSGFGAAMMLTASLSNLTFVSASSSRGACFGTSTVVCSLGPIASGVTVTATIVATVNAPGGSIFDASVRGIVVDPVEANNRALVVRTAFTDDPLLAGMTIKAAHLTELRAAIDLKRTLAGLGPASYATDPAIVPGSTRVKAAHLNEACAALKAAIPAASCSTIAEGQTVGAATFTSMRTAVRADE